MSTPRKPSAALGWFPHIAVNESAVIDMANSRQIALRERLRNHYWVTECKPLGVTTVALMRKKMAMIDTRDTLTDAEVSELLSDHYGFVATDAGLTIPELDEHHGVAIGSMHSTRERLSEGGRIRAAAAVREGGRFVASVASPKVVSTSVGEDF